MRRVLSLLLLAALCLTLCLLPVSQAQTSSSSSLGSSLGSSSPASSTAAAASSSSSPLSPASSSALSSSTGLASSVSSSLAPASSSLGSSAPTAATGLSSSGSSPAVATAGSSSSSPAAVSAGSSGSSTTALSAGSSSAPVSAGSSSSAALSAGSSSSSGAAAVSGSSSPASSATSTGGSSAVSAGSSGSSSGVSAPASSSSSAAALASSSGGGSVTLPALCNAPTSCPATATEVPTPWFDLEFSNAPAMSGYGYQSTSGDACPHSGVILTGQQGGVSDGNTPGFVDLNAATGNNSGGSVLPGDIGGASGNLSSFSAGWTFEVTFKPTLQTTWAKVFCIGNGAGVGDIILGYNSGNLEFDFTVDTATGGTSPFTQNTAGNIQVIQNPNVALNTWYHIAIVLQQVDASALFSNWFVYVNGVLQPASPAANNAPFFMPPSMARPSSYLGRSCYNGDQLFVSEMDAFRIYDSALNAAQVSALYAQQMAACSSAVTFTSSPASVNTFPNTMSSATAPLAPILTLNFSTDPSVYALPDAASYGWVAQDNGDAACGINAYHQGVLVLEGSPDQTELYSDFSYVNLSTPTGPNGVGVTAPVLGGSGYGSGNAALGTAGLTFEMTFKPALMEEWGKLMDLGTTRAMPFDGTCNNDIVFGWVSNSLLFMNFEVCDGNGNGWNTADFGPFTAGLWYHVVIVLQELPNNLTSWYVYVNNVVLATNANNGFFPAAAVRNNANIGKSNWDDEGWAGWLDTFNIYDQALSSQQISALYNTALGPSHTLGCPVTVSNTSVIPASALYFDLTFATDPAPAGVSPAYDWLPFDPTDSTSDQTLHTGIVNISGCIPGTCAGSYINLSTATGPYSVSKVLGDVGGVGTGSVEDGTVGWSFEFVFKVLSQTQWSKMMDLGDGDSGGDGVWEILYGWHNTDQFYSTSVEWSNSQDYQNANYTQLDDLFPATPTLSFNTWYHSVVVYQYSTAYTDTPGTQYTAPGGITYDGGMQFSGYSVYLNGALTANATQRLYPQRVQRRNSVLGKSNYLDDFWQGTLDTFRVYSIALNPNQITALYQQTLTVQPPPGSSSSSGTVPVVSSSAGSSSVSSGAVVPPVSSSGSAAASSSSSSAAPAPAVSSSSAAASSAAAVPSSSSALPSSTASLPSSTSAVLTPTATPSSSPSSVPQAPTVVASSSATPPIVFVTSSSAVISKVNSAPVAASASSLLVAAAVALASLLSLLL